MSISLLHKLVSNPFIYDLSQKLAGFDKTTKLFKEEFSLLPRQGTVLDVGGGTGLMRPLFAPEWEYCCLDSDPQKLAGFESKFPKDNFLQASACKIPKPDKSFDLCIMVAVTHHLTDNDFGLALQEIKRVLRPAGQLLIMDAIWNPTNLRGRLLWSVDRGSFPKTASALEEHLKSHFCIERKRMWKVHHDYALYWCHKI